MISTTGKRIHERLKSIVDVFMDACHVWVNYSHDNLLLSEIEKTQHDLSNLDMEQCSEEDIHSIQDMTTRMLEQINDSLKTSGFGGLRYKGIKH